MAWNPRWTDVNGFNTPHRMPSEREVWVWGPCIPVTRATYHATEGCIVTDDGEAIAHQNVTHFDDDHPADRPPSTPEVDPKRWDGWLYYWKGQAPCSIELGIFQVELEDGEPLTLHRHADGFRWPEGRLFRSSEGEFRRLQRVGDLPG